MSARKELWVDCQKEATVSATALVSDGWQVSLCLGMADGSGQYMRVMSAVDARELAAALIQCADHYDAETARLAAEVRP